MTTEIMELSFDEIDMVAGGDINWTRVFNNTTTGLVGGAIAGGVAGSFLPGAGTIAGAAAGGVTGAVGCFFGTLADEFITADADGAAG